MKPSFATLIILTLVTAGLLAPFALSPVYIPWMRDQTFELLEIIRTDEFKLITGFIALTFALFEMVLALRKRGRQWKISIPGSMKLWRSLHIFSGVGLIFTILVHTGGSMGDNFNTVFLWVFFGTALSALVGVVAETGIIESPRKRFSFFPTQLGFISKMSPEFSKGPLIRGLRLFWLSTHIILVSLFLVLLGFHIFLAFYFQ